MPSKNELSFQELMEENVIPNVKTNALSDAIDFIGKNLNPDDVFRDKDLESWAESNGYVKEEK